MMNLENIALRINEPQLCDSNDISSFKELAEKYPFTQVFSILYLKALAHNNDIRFEEELQKHAFRVTDRIRLYDLIEGQGQPQTVAIANEAIQSDSSKVEIVVDSLPVPAENSTENDTEDFAEKQDVTIAPEEIIPVDIQPETLQLAEVVLQSVEDEYEEETEFIGEKEIISDVEEIEEEELEEEAILTENQENLAGFEFEVEELSVNDSVVLDPIEIVEDPIDSTLTVPFIIEQIEPTKKEVFVEQLIPVEEFQQEITEVAAVAQEDTKTLDSPELVEFETEIISQAIAGVFDIGLLERLDENESRLSSTSATDSSAKAEVGAKKSFSSWLHASVAKQSESAEALDLGVEVSSQEQEEVPVLNVTESVITEPKTPINEIIENFIKEEPKISRLPKEEIKVEKEKVEFFSPVKKAKLSIDENRMPVSETLAKIFEAQGNFPKAIYAYEQLILIIPEKKTFFANRIEKLKGKLNT